MTGTAPTGWVFRDACQQRLATDVLTELGAAVARARTGNESDQIAAFLDAAAAEAALADAATVCPPARPAARRIALLVDALTNDWLRRGKAPEFADFAPDHASLRGIRLRLSVPEGFAYYALDPRGFAAAVLRVAGDEPAVAVVGLRTIGAALSAVAHAALSQAGRHVARITVRPEGHPYDRRLALAAGDRDWVRRHADAGARFLIVDEGPGLSGTTLIATAEALREAGAPVHRIGLLGTRDVNPDQLVGRDAARRFRLFRYDCAHESQRPFSPGHDLSGGAWRAIMAVPQADWPAVWPAMERRKILPHAEPGVLMKFEGLGRHGAVAFERAMALQEWGPRPAAPPDPGGFVRYHWVAGRPMAAADASDAVLRFLVRYLAARTRLLPAPAAASLTDLGAVARANVAAVLGEQRDVPEPMVQQPIVVDGRMAPHELLTDPAGRLVKVDGVSHGDDHFQPGPTDVAWDIAGVVSEWRLDRGARARLISLFRQATGDDPTARLPAFEIAYVATRAAWCSMAAHASPAEDARRLQAQAAQLRHDLHGLLAAPRP